MSDFLTLIPSGRSPLFAGKFGIALDLGTTTVAAALVELSGGKIVTRATALNAQVKWGDNVLSRIQACQTDPAKVEILQRSILQDTLGPLLRQLLRQAAVEEKQVGGMVVAGNTTMLHLLCGVDPTPMGRMPFRPSFLGVRNLAGIDLGLPEAWRVVLLPGLSVFVGADITAGVVCTGLPYADGASLLVDVGTNGEIFLASPEGRIACATAAGPAFEGSGLLAGMRAGPGAVGHLRLDSDTLETALEIIGGAHRSPIGLAGSAYIDFLAEGRRVGLLTQTGRFSTPKVEKYPARFAEVENGRAFLLLDSGSCLRIGEVDVALLLQAKAAIAAGIETLLARKGLKPEKISRLFLAGGFGRHLSVPNALAAGLLPGFTAEQIKLVGNTALGGAYLALLDESLLAEMEALEVETLELNEDPSFEDRFVENLLLP